MKRTLLLLASRLAAIAILGVTSWAAAGTVTSPASPFAFPLETAALKPGECIPPVITGELQPLIRCLGDTAVFHVDATGTNLQYEWSHGFIIQPQYTTDTVVINPVTIDDRGIWCVRVYNACGSTESCTRLSVSQCGGTFCTLTQGAYGSAGGAGNLTQITNLLAQGDLVLGELGARSVTFQPGQATALCILARLPTGGGSGPLPNFGDQILNTASCNTAPPLPLKNGRFKNNFLGQVLTLSLNTRAYPALLGLVLCDQMITDDNGVINIPHSVIIGMPALGFGHTVAGLLNLANRALANGNIGSIPFDDIHAAVGAINDGFDECKVLVDCNSK